MKHCCHCQNIERIVGRVTKASEKRYGYEKRHKFVINLLESREKMPKLKTGQTKITSFNLPFYK